MAITNASYTYTCDRCAKAAADVATMPDGWCNATFMGANMMSAGGILCDDCIAETQTFMDAKGYSKFVLKPVTPPSPGTPA